MSTVRSAVGLVVAVAICEAAGIVGAVFTTPAIPTWYAGLAKSALTPPAWVFGPVWTTLYALMGIAAYLAWRTRAPSAGRALWLFALQLALNVLWSVVFFGYRAPAPALLVIALLWLAIAATIAAFAKLSRAGAWLLAPYLLWVSFAAYLNLAIVLMNP
ncbi:MAG TPA: TspO/MBR family protein [Candidatus Paceibacterota bacterium]|nr:TspO/MBR family protein [Candidatus Paceibacterota bacterium]